MDVVVVYIVIGGIFLRFSDDSCFVDFFHKPKLLYDFFDTLKKIKKKIGGFFASFFVVFDLSFLLKFFVFRWCILAFCIFSVTVSVLYIL